jgi:HK97 family phage prohead protease
MKTKTIYPLFTGVINKGLNEEPTYRFVASTDTIDRHGERILVSAWKLDNYKKNPIILFGHDAWSLENAIGKSVAIEIQENKLVIDVVFSQANERAQKVRAMVDEGVLNMVSVGFIPKKIETIDGVPTITEAELLEVSIVQIPANPEAESIRTLGFKLNDIGEVEFEVEAKEEAPKEEEDEEKKEEEEEAEEVEIPDEAKAEATPEETPETPKEDELSNPENPNNSNEEENEDEEVEVEVEEEDEDDEESDEEVDVEIEIEGEEENDLQDEKSLAIIQEKEGRTLSSATLEKIASVTSVAKEAKTSINSLISALETLVSETGDKSLEDYVLLKKTELKALREIMRSQDRTSEKALSVIKNLIK